MRTPWTLWFNGGAKSFAWSMFSLNGEIWLHIMPSQNMPVNHQYRNQWAVDSDIVVVSMPWVPFRISDWKVQVVVWGTHG